MYDRVVVLVDAQNDFISPDALGSAEALAAAERIADEFGERYENWVHNPSYQVLYIATYDCHEPERYETTVEGQKVPPHCIVGTEGWNMDPVISAHAPEFSTVLKSTFGSFTLPKIIEAAGIDENTVIELWGFCTNICVISNALILRSAFPNNRIEIKEKCCAGTSPEAHAAALLVARSNLIEVV